MAAAVAVVLAGGDRRERDTVLVRDPDDFLHLLGRLRTDRSRRTGRHLTANRVGVAIPGKVAVLGGDELRANDVAEAGDGGVERGLGHSRGQHSGHGISLSVVS